MRKEKIQLMEKIKSCKKIAGTGSGIK
jgi:hypothetical protein